MSKEDIYKRLDTIDLSEYLTHTEPISDIRINVEWEYNRHFTYGFEDYDSDADIEFLNLTSDELMMYLSKRYDVSFYGGYLVL